MEYNTYYDILGVGNAKYHDTWREKPLFGCCVVCA
jgi:hypothetical protein